ncbi:MAG: hypothetical protein MOGMAGMI_01453 [Candidatus Omnitrophica bacterium]|nr:hypothetical protein [Candidatus Omnitrophota bacterium]
MTTGSPAQAVSSEAVSLRSLRWRLLLVVALAMLPVLGLSTLSWREQRRLVYDKTTDELLRVVRLASITQDHLLSGIRQEMRLLASLDELRAGSPAEIQKLLGEWVRTEPYCVNMGLINTDGSIYASVLPPPPGVNLADRKYFQRALSERTFTMGQYVLGRITGKHTLNFGYPVYREDGEVRGVLYYALGLEWMHTLLSKADPPLEAVFTVVDRTGTVLARHPDPGGLVGRQLANAPLVKALLTASGEGTVELRGLDGIQRVYAYRPIEISGGDTGIYAAIGVPSSIVYGPVVRMVRLSLIALMLSLALAGLAAWLVGDALVIGVQRRLHEASVTDALTGLRNRRGFFLLVEQSARQAVRTKKGFWLAALDVDGLKKINDTQGHAEGDRLIIAAARALQRAFRESDIIGRLGGDEFVVAAIDAPKEQLTALQRRLDEGIAKGAGEGSPPVRLSAGWAYFDPAETGLTIDALLARADEALYTDKERRRGI